MVKRRLASRRVRQLEVPKKPRPSDGEWVATVDWKARVLAALKSKGKSQNWLGKQVGLTSARMSQLFGESARQHESRTDYLPRINAELTKLGCEGFPPPKQVTHDDEAAIDAAKSVVDAEWHHLTDEDRDYIRGLVTRLARRSEPS